MNNLTLRTLTSPYINDVTRGSVLSQADVDNNFIFLKGNIVYTAETIGNIVTLKRFNGDDLSFIAGETFTGGTVSGATNFIGGLTADTFSATTYFGLPQDIYVTGGTYDNINGTLTLINNSGATFDIVGLGINGGNINVNSITANTILSTGITTTTISATTYYNLPQDVYVTGGTFSNGTFTYTNNTGGTFNVYGSTTYAAGVISGATGWTKVVPNNGQINLPPIKVALFNNSNNIEPVIVYDVASGTTGVGAIPSLTDNDTNYVVVEYNGGSPRYYVYDNDGVVDDSSVVLYMIVYRLGNFVHTLEFGNQGAGLANKLNDRFLMTDRFGYESGLIIGLSGTGVVTLTSGVAWNGVNRQTLNQCDSSGNTFFKNYHVGGSWTATTTGKTFNNSYYDNGTDIVSGTTGKYLTNWYFRGQEINDHLYEVYGTNEYDSVSLAEASPEPILPELVSSHAFLVGRAIVGVGQTTGVTQTAFGVVFQPSGNFSSTSVHNNLTGLQGGIGGEYYHLTSNQYNNLTLTNTTNNFTPQQIFSGGLSANTISATTYVGLPTGPISVVSVSSLFSTGLSNTGFQASGVTDSNFFGANAGNSATGASQSNFFGNAAGYQATNASQSNFFGFNSGFQATNALVSNFIGAFAGYAATGASYSNFMGYNAGRDARIASDSNFIGRQAGQGATNANNSQFMGTNAGFQATGASNSVFVGPSAGFQATGATYSNLIGGFAGYQASGASQSNFMGRQSGYQATNATNSNFFGFNAGFAATGASNSNFIGFNSGNAARNASDSNFIGRQAGQGATNALGSNFMGTSAGFQATGASLSIFVGTQTGYQARLAVNSVFMGSYAGYQATNASNSNFIGLTAGSGASGASESNFFGNAAGGAAFDAYDSNFIGANAGYSATDANNSNFIGTSAGYQATNADNSNFIGVQAGYSATGAFQSNFMGYNTGNGATGAAQSNFMGTGTGQDATNASDSNFFGFNAGYQATNASNSNFIGFVAGGAAFDANNSNFIGVQAGYSATGASQSNFMGDSAGYSATNALGSNFIGANAGYQATGASYSNLFGYAAGRALSTSNSVGTNNIIIGTNITLSAGTINSINIGGVLFGNGTYSTLSGGPSTGATANGKIGIGVNAPKEKLDVSGAVKISNGGYTGLSNGATTPVPTGGAGTMVFDSVTSHFFGWNGTSWRQLDN